MARRVGGTARGRGRHGWRRWVMAQGREGWSPTLLLSFASWATEMFTRSPLCTELPQLPCLPCVMDCVCLLNCEPSTLLQMTSVSHSVTVTGNNLHCCLYQEHQGTLFAWSLWAPGEDSRTLLVLKWYELSPQLGKGIEHWTTCWFSQQIILFPVPHSESTLGLSENRALSILKEHGPVPPWMSTQTQLSLWTDEQGTHPTSELCLRPKPSKDELSWWAGQCQTLSASGGHDWPHSRLFPMLLDQKILTVDGDEDLTT